MSSASPRCEVPGGSVTQAVILAGGLGTRLRPLTETVPKPLLPIMNVPMVDGVVNMLPKDVDRVIIAVSYMSEKIRAHFEGRWAEAMDRVDMEVIVVKEVEPLGTGGAVKNVERYIDDTMVVFNGDIVASLDVDRMVATHRGHGGIGTIAVWRVDEPEHYGVIETAGASGRITGFVEKPSREEARSDMINAGTYVLEPEVLDRMVMGRVTSMEREVFPFVLDKGMHAFPFEGYWFDAGKPRDYLAIHRRLMEEWDSTIGLDGTVGHGLAGRDCTVSADAIVGPHVCLGDRVVVEEGAVIEDTVIFEGTIVRSGAEIRGSIIGRNSKVGKDARIEGSVIGDDTMVDTGEELGEGSKLWSGYER